MGVLNTVRFVIRHPLNEHQPLAALKRFICWQLGSRLLPGAAAVEFVNETRLLVKPGMTGATGNIYAGLHEFEDMAFVLHFLRPGDLFADVGANVGSYTVLAAGAVGTKCISLEPVYKTFQHLKDNINLNNLQTKVLALNVGVGRSDGKLRFTSSLDTMNHAATDKDINAECIEVDIKRLDNLLGDQIPILMKIDVEGMETDVVAGAEKTFANEKLLAVIMELNGSGLRYGFNDKDLHNSMLNFGFSAFAYSPFSRKLVASSNGKSITGHNTIYVRNVELVQERLASAPKFRILSQSL